MLVIQSAQSHEIETKITNDYDHDKHITTQESNKLTTENFSASLVNLANRNDIVNFVKKPQILMIN